MQEQKDEENTANDSNNEVTNDNDCRDNIGGHDKVTF